jgi:hypothetical protein
VVLHAVLIAVGSQCHQHHNELTGMVMDIQQVPVPASAAHLRTSASVSFSNDSVHMHAAHQASARDGLQSVNRVGPLLILGSQSRAAASCAACILSESLLNETI